jgi:hypothetical protein
MKFLGIDLRNFLMLPVVSVAFLCLVVALGYCCWANQAAADTLPGSTTPVKIAVFPFELEDFSAAGQKGSAPTEISYLAQATEEARQQLLKSGRYSLVNTAADPSAAKEQGLRNCGGCEAPIAGKLGADQALVGVITKISMTEYTVRLLVSDTRNNQIVSNFSTDLRMGADYSWSRGVRWLMQNRMLTSK